MTRHNPYKSAFKLLPVEDTGENTALVNKSRGDLDGTSIADDENDDDTTDDKE
jgi:hypothetical protein